MIGFNTTRVADDCDKARAVRGARWTKRNGQGGRNVSHAFLALYHNSGSNGQRCRWYTSGRTITYACRFRLRRSDTAVRRIGVADKRRSILPSAGKGVHAYTNRRRLVLSSNGARRLSRGFNNLLTIRKDEYFIYGRTRRLKKIICEGKTCGSVDNPVKIIF